MRRMKYPEKYPNGFMYAAVDELKTKEERVEALRAGSQHFLDKIAEAINGSMLLIRPWYSWHCRSTAIQSS